MIEENQNPNWPWPMAESEQEKFSVEEIKKAFWAEFHGVADRFFEYRGSEEENTACTEIYWQSFLEHLRKTDAQI